jgi:hypothetical protein
MAPAAADRVGAIAVIKPMALPRTPMAEYLSDPPTAPAQRFEGAGVSAETGEGLARVLLTDLLDWHRREEAVGALMGRFATRKDEVDDLFRLHPRHHRARGQPTHRHLRQHGLGRTRGPGR